MSKFYKDKYLVKEYIYYYMQKHKFSKSRFCKECGVKRKVLRQIERQDSDLNIEDILQVFNFIGVHPKYMFITLEGEKL